VEQLSVLLRITPNGTRLRVLGVAPVDDGIISIADDRRFPVALPQARLVLDAVLRALDGHLRADAATQDVLEALDGVW